MFSPGVNAVDDTTQQNANQQFMYNNHSNEQSHQQHRPIPHGWRTAMANSQSRNVQSNCNVFKGSQTVDRVKNALSGVSNGLSPAPLPAPPLPPTFPSSPTFSPSPAFVVPDSPKRRGRKKKECLENGAVGATASDCGSSSTSNVIVKKRFIHSRSLLTGHCAPDSKKVKTELEQIPDNYVPTDSQQDAIFPSSESSVKPLSNLSVTLQPPHPPSSSTCTDSQVPRLSSPQLQTCPCCKSAETTCISNNFFKCLKCHKQYMPIRMLPRRSNTQGVSPAATFYGVPHISPARMLNSIPQTQPKSRASNGRAAKANKGSPKKRKQAETIDLVSSDEEEEEASSNHAETAGSSVTDASLTPLPVSTVVDHMRQPGGMLPVHSKTPTPPPFSSAADLSPSPSPVPSPVPPPAPSTPMENGQGEYKFHCNKAMFGELYGHTLAPTRVAENRIYLSLECIIHRDSLPISEKYTLSVGQNDVQQVMVYFGRVPSLVAIETTNRFAEVACRRIGRDVLVPGSEDPKKRYIILALISAFKNDNEAAVEIGHLIHCISPWARITIISHEEAERMISQADLDVSQQEVCFGKPAKPIGPVETLLIYPVPPKTGGIPVTTDDVACLAEGVYLNDVIIDFYLKYTFETILTPEQQERTYIFNSYFYKRLTQKQTTKSSPDQMHAQVKKWTRNVDIFEKDFIVIPVNEHCHWYLVIICFPGKGYLNTDDLNEKDEEEDEDEIADFTKESTDNDSAIDEPDSKLKNSLENSGMPMQVSDENAVRTSVEGKVDIKEINQSKQTEVERNDTLKENLPNDPIKTSITSTDDQTSSRKSTSDEKLVTQISNTDEPEQKSTVYEKATEQVSSADATEQKSSPAEDAEQKCSVEEKDADQKSSPENQVPEPKKTIEEKIIPKQAFELDDFFRPCILIFDSLVGSGHSRVFTNLRHYLTKEWSSRKSAKQPKVFDKTNMKGCYPKIPRQNNDCDCGVFLLQYAEWFFTQPIKNYRMPVHLENWFAHELVSKKRQEIKSLILDLADNYKNRR